MSAKLVILDLDGTLFRGSEPTPYAAETVSELRRRGSIVRFLTNNSSQTQSALAEKLTKMGIAAVPEEVVYSSMGAAKLLVDRGQRSAFVVGEAGLEAALSARGITLTGDRPDAVVVGICRSFTYDWLDRALQCLNQGALFVATNRDATYPLEGGRVQPGAGAIVAAIATCSGKEPIVVGKPEPTLVFQILEETGIAPDDALMVGDRMDTDIEAGLRAGVPTHLVLCGVTKIAPEGQRWSEDVRGVLD